MGPTRRGPVAVAGFEAPRCARGMAKERPGNTVCELERQGAGHWHAAARRRRARRSEGAARAVRDVAARRRPARNYVNVPCFERVKLQKIA
jgi:hypothetical protein